MNKKKKMKLTQYPQAESNRLEKPLWVKISIAPHGWMENKITYASILWKNLCAICKY